MNAEAPLGTVALLVMLRPFNRVYAIQNSYGLPLFMLLPAAFDDVMREITQQSNTAAAGGNVPLFAMFLTLD